MSNPGKTHHQSRSPGQAPGAAAIPGPQARGDRPGWWGLRFPAVSAPGRPGL